MVVPRFTCGALDGAGLKLLWAASAGGKTGPLAVAAAAAARASADLFGDWKRGGEDDGEGVGMHERQRLFLTAAHHGAGLRRLAARRRLRTGVAGGVGHEARRLALRRISLARSMELCVRRLSGTVAQSRVVGWRPEKDYCKRCGDSAKDTRG